MGEPLRVMVVDDNPVVRSGLIALLESEGEIEVVGEAGDGHRALELADRLRPDLVLLDVNMPLIDGVTAALSLADFTRVLMLTYSDAPDVIRASIRNGADGYLVHGSFTAAELMAAVRDIAYSGRNPMSAVAVTALMDAVRGDGAGAPTVDRSRFGLSARETEVMELITQGASNREIAATLYLTEKTVKNHINRIFAKLLVNNRAAAIAEWLGTVARGYAQQSTPRLGAFTGSAGPVGRTGGSVISSSEIGRAGPTRGTRNGSPAGMAQNRPRRKK
ncbi:response regulator [Actinoallomurus iriomotensis]|uniref:Uncharacterized protein n=1 Tax=Actinoallomurus iriomotensis TaxID=478107 RepID=A0A9W6W0V2_9ACTN|nr:hypothetical protein Airi02_032400 [Actinoallomurus iriomotensis]